MSAVGIGPLPRWLALALALGSLVLISCGDPANERRVDDPPVYGDRADHLGGAGSPIAEGLVVPPGGFLLGAAFPEPDVYSSPPGSDGAEQVGIDPKVAVPDTWVAHIEVTGADPFATYDQLAAQIRGLPAPLTVPGTAASCVWTLPDGAEELSDALIVAESEAPANSDGVECGGTAGERKLGRVHRYELGMQVKAGFATTLTVRSVWAPPGAAGPPRGWATTLRRQASTDGRDVAAGPDPVPADRASMLPEPTPTVEVVPDEAFGSEVNCFAAKGYARFVLPEGATFVGGSWRGDELVLAVDDLDAALTVLERQVLDGVEDEPVDEAQTETLAVAGGTVRRWSYSVSGGGGACSAQSSPDGRYLLVGLHAD
jgi:hypothetical protein